MKKIFNFIRLVIRMQLIALREPDKYNIIKTVVNGNPFDYSYLWEIERAKLIEMREYFKTSNIAESDEVVSREISFAVKLLDIIMDDSNLYHFEDQYPDEPKEDMFINDKDGSSILNNGYWRRHHQYKCDVYCNTRNIDRFIKDDKVKDYYIKHPHELYVEKARYLYHLTRHRLEQNWSN